MDPNQMYPAIKNDKNVLYPDTNHFPVFLNKDEDYGRKTCRDDAETNNLGCRTRQTF